MNRQRFRRRTVIVVAADINLFACRRDLSSERLILHGLCLVEHIGRALLKVVHRIAQVGSLRVVDVDYVLAGSNRQRFFRNHAVVVVAVDFNHFVRRIDHFIERHPVLNLRIVKHIERILLKVVHRVAQVVPLRVVDVDHVLAGSNLQRILIHAVVVVAVDLNHFIRRRDLSLERHTVLNLLIVEHLVRVLLKVIHLIAQVGSLRVVDVDHVLASSNRQRFRIHAVVVVAADINLFVCRRDRILVRHPALNLLIVEHLVCDLLKVVHRVALVGLLRVIDLNNVLAFILCNRQRAVHRRFVLIPTFRLELEIVFFDRTSVQRTDGIGSGRVYFAVVVMLDLILVGVRRIVHIDNRVFATYKLLHGIMSIRIGVAGYIFNIFFF